MRHAEEEKAPDTMPSVREPATSGEQPVKKRGRPKRSATPTVGEILDDIEKKGGVVIPEFVMLVLRSYRSLEATNRAQKALIVQYVEEIKRLKGKK